MAATRPYRDAARAALPAVAVLAAAALVAAVVGAVLMRAGTPVRATSLVQVSAFGSNPGALDMYVYRPDGLPVGAPVVVALHGCTQTAEDYWAHSGWPALADARRFALVLPQ